MVFVNEYVSEEDIQQYDIDGLWRKYVYGEGSTRTSEDRKKLKKL